MPDRASTMRHAASLAVLGLLSACAVVPQTAAPVSPPPAPAPPPPPPPPRPVAVAPEQPWDVAPLAQGDWSYKRDQQGTAASFGRTGTEASLEIRCRSGARQLTVSRLGASGQAVMMTIRTSAGNLQWPAQSSRDGLEMTIATRAAGDTGFDWMAFSRGRISVEVPGLPRLIVPVWAEISRVIEDCRG